MSDYSKISEKIYNEILKTPVYTTYKKERNKQINIILEDGMIELFIFIVSFIGLLSTLLYFLFIEDLMNIKSFIFTIIGVFSLLGTMVTFFGLLPYLKKIKEAMRQFGDFKNNVIIDQINLIPLFEDVLTEEERKQAKEIIKLNNDDKIVAFRDFVKLERKYMEMKIKSQQESFIRT